MLVLRVEERRSDVLRSDCWCEERTQPAPAPEISTCCSVQGNCGVAGSGEDRGKG